VISLSPAIISRRACSSYVVSSIDRQGHTPRAAPHYACHDLIERLRGRPVSGQMNLTTVPLLPGRRPPAAGLSQCTFPFLRPALASCNGGIYMCIVVVDGAAQLQLHLGHSASLSDQLHWRASPGRMHACRLLLQSSPLPSHAAMSLPTPIVIDRRIIHAVHAPLFSAVTSNPRVHHIISSSPPLRTPHILWSRILAVVVASH